MVYIGRFRWVSICRLLFLLSFGFSPFWSACAFNGRSDEMLPRGSFICLTQPSHDALPSEEAPA